jgi:hypothetical protein
MKRESIESAAWASTKTSRVRRVEKRSLGVKGGG